MLPRLISEFPLECACKMRAGALQADQEPQAAAPVL